MRARPWRGALGLRGRIVGAVLVTTVATLVVAAVALLGPLEQSLRTAAKRTLQSELHNATDGFKRLSLLPLGVDQQHRLAAAQGALARKVGATVTVLGYPNSEGNDSVPLTPNAGEIESTSADVAAAFRTGRPQYSFSTTEGTDYARAALPFTDSGLKYVLAVRRPIEEIPGAVAAVRTAFLTAALVALVLTLILAIPLAATIVRRLRRLRQSALQLAHGDLAVRVPVDRARDEVGDLARTFATMQTQLHQQEEARRAFVATASHELRTPLASLDGMLELLDDDLRSGEPDLDDARDLLERARGQSRRLGRLAVDLLDLSRLDADVRLRSEPVELGELSRAVLAEFELGTAERGIVSRLDDSSGEVWALADPGSVARILRILLDNAVRASPEREEVRVELHNGDGAFLSVRDHGPGVPPEERDLIFERFQRGRATGGQAGFGLGLAIGRELARRMGGELELEAVDGPGARFTLKLPATQAPDQDPAVLVGR